MKQKTKQAARKRFSVTGQGKLQRRAVQQAHFNSRDRGEETRSKRGYRLVHQADLARVAEVLPYAK